MVISVFMVACLCYNLPKKDNVSQVLSKMSFEEKVFLEYFFRELLLKDNGIYVLNGAKPAAITGYFDNQYYFDRLFWNSFKRDVLLKRGIEVWKKYACQIPTNHYSILCTENREENGFQILLMNNERFLRELSSEDFVKEVTSASEVLAKLVNEKKVLSEAVNNHAALEGILLGFGRHNSWLFYQREIENYGYIPKKMNSKGVSKKLQFPTNEPNQLLFTRLPCYLSETGHPESDALKKDYLRQRKELTRFYRDGNFLEKVLRKFQA